jgi:hypothetical protein
MIGKVIWAVFWVAVFILLRRLWDAALTMDSDAVKEYFDISDRRINVYTCLNKKYLHPTIKGCKPGGIDTCYEDTSASFEVQ